MSKPPLTHLHPQLRILATKADRARDQVARLVQLLGTDPLNDPTRMSMFPWPVFLEHYNTVIHQLTDLSTYLSSTPPFTTLFIHPSHALPQADQAALYGGAGASVDPPLRPVVGKGYADERTGAYASFANDLQSLAGGKKETAQGGLKMDYAELEKVGEDLKIGDEVVNFSLMEARDTSVLDSALSRLTTLLENFKERQSRARAVVDGLRGGFEWESRLDKEFSVVREAEEKTREEDDAEGSEEETSGDEEMEQVPDARTLPPAFPSPSLQKIINPALPAVPATDTPSATTPAANSKTSEVIDLDEDDDDLFGENDSSAPGGTPAAVGGEHDDEDDDEMEEVA